MSEQFRDVRRMDPELAGDLIEVFKQRFNEPTYFFAMHAAFPMALTPDLLYRLWVNFQIDTRERPLDIPWVATADLLLSDLVRPVGHEIYEMDGSVRDRLLADLNSRDDCEIFPCFGAQRVKELSHFLFEYFAPQINAPNRYVRQQAQSQQLVAQAYRDPPAAIQALARQITESIQNGDFSAQIHIASIVELLSTALRQQADFAELWDYSRRRAVSIEGRPVPPPPVDSAGMGSFNVAGIDLPALDENLPEVDPHLQASQLIVQARQALTEQRYAEAQSYLERTRQLQPDYPNLDELLEQVELLQKANELAVKAEQALNSGQFEEALSLIQQAIQLQPDHPRLRAMVRTIEKARDETESEIAQRDKQRPKPTVYAPDKWLNFEIRFRFNGSSLDIQVDSPAGDLLLPLDWEPRDPDLKEFDLLISRFGARAPLPNLLKEWGERLFTTVFWEGCRDLYQRSLMKAQESRSGLRILLDFGEAPHLQNLPWEYMYDSHMKEYIALVSYVAILRYSDHRAAQKARPPSQPPLRLLTIVSDPKDLPLLDSDGEIKALREAFDPQERSGRLDAKVRAIEQSGLEELRSSLKQERPHILFLVSRGTYDDSVMSGTLGLPDESGQTRWVPVSELGQVFEAHLPTLVVISASQGSRAGQRDALSGVAQGLIRFGVPMVVAAQYDSSRDGSRIFTLEFTRALLAGETVEQALSITRRAMADQDYFEWGNYTLFTSLRQSRSPSLLSASWTATIGIHIEGDEIGLSLLREVIEGGLASHFVQEDPGRAILQVLAEQNAFYITRVGEDELLAPPVEGYERESLVEVGRILEHITRWIQVADLTKAWNYLPPDAIEFRMTSDGHDLSTEDQPLKYHRKGGEWVPPVIDISVHNNTDQIIYACVFILEEDHSISILNRQNPLGNLEPGKEYAFYSGKAVFPDRSLPSESTIRRSIVKLIAATTPYDPTLLEQGSIGEKKRLSRITLTEVFKPFFEEPQSALDEPYTDWTARNCTISVKRPPSGSAPAFQSRAGWTLGINVSRWQGEIDWEQVAADSAGVRFALIKSTQGEKIQDPLFKANLQGARRAGLLAGAYHVFHFSEDPIRQANFFNKVAGSRLQDSDLPPVVDIEPERPAKSPTDSKGDRSNDPASRRASDLRRFLDRVEQQTGRKPIIFTNVDTWKDLLKDSTAFSAYPLWIAQYGDIKKPSLPAQEWGKQGWSFWQFTMEGRIQGVGSKNVDLNWFQGDEVIMHRAFGPLQDEVSKATDSEGQAVQVDRKDRIFVGDDLYQLSMGLITDLENTSEQIDLIEECLNLSDLLRQIQSQVYEVLVIEAQRFPENDSLNILSDCLANLEHILVEVKSISDQRSTEEPEIYWVEDLLRGQDELSQALEERDAKLLQKVIRRLQKVNDIQLVWLNKQLAEHAESMRLPSLLNGFRDLSKELKLQERLDRQLQQSLTSLEKFSEDLNESVRQFGQWVSIENELGRLHTSLATDLKELELYWPDLQNQISGLTEGHSEVWADDLITRKRTLEEALSTDEPDRIRSAFGAFNRNVSRRSLQITIDLKGLLSNIRQSLEPLISILDIGKPSDNLTEM